MYTLISGSPKTNSSNSMYFLEKVKDKLKDYNLFELKKCKYKELLSSIKKSDVIILAFPLYVDSPTSIMLEFLDYIIENNISFKNKYIYAIINCGFREGEHNITALNIIKNWCDKVNAIYNGSILIGAGEIVGKDKYKFISKKALSDLDYFINKVIKKEKSDDIITTMDLLNNKLYCYIANLFWNKKARLNKLSYSKITEK